MECKLQAICKFCQQEAAPFIQIPDRTPALPLPDPTAKRHYTRKTPVGGGSIKEKLAGRVWHCKKCDFTAPNAGVMAAHCRLTHPKGKTGRKPEKKVTANSQPANDKEAEHAFEVLKKRANKGTLSGENLDAYDNIEPSIIGKKSKDWPDGARESIIKLYKEITEEDKE